MDAFWATEKDVRIAAGLHLSVGVVSLVAVVCAVSSVVRDAVGPGSQLQWRAHLWLYVVLLFFDLGVALKDIVEPLLAIVDPASRETCAGACQLFGFWEVFNTAFRGALGSVYIVVVMSLVLCWCRFRSQESVDAVKFSVLLAFLFATVCATVAMALQQINQRGGGTWCWIAHGTPLAVVSAYLGYGFQVALTLLGVASWFCCAAPLQLSRLRGHRIYVIAQRVCLSAIAAVPVAAILILAHVMPEARGFLFAHSIVIPLRSGWDAFVFFKCEPGLLRHTFLQLKQSRRSAYSAYHDDTGYDPRDGFTAVVWHASEPLSSRDGSVSRVSSLLADPIDVRGTRVTPTW